MIDVDWNLLKITIILLYTYDIASYLLTFFTLILHYKITCIEKVHFNEKNRLNVNSKLLFVKKEEICFAKDISTQNLPTQNIPTPTYVRRRITKMCIHISRKSEWKICKKESGVFTCSFI